MDFQEKASSPRCAKCSFLFEIVRGFVVPVQL